MTSREPGVRIAFRNLRIIEALDQRFEPGLSLIVGPTGSGKTTLLNALSFFAELASRSLHDAVLELGSGYLRRLDADDGDPTTLEIQVDEACWTISIPATGLGVERFHGEALRVGAEQVFSSLPGEPSVQLPTGPLARGDGSVLSILRGSALSASSGGFPEWLDRIRVYRDWSPARLRGPSDERGAHHGFLHHNGQNLWNVLRNWKSAPRKSGNRFGWVVEHAREAFPDIFSDLEFPLNSPPEFYSPRRRRRDDGLPVTLAPDGLLSGLHHLAATASADPGGLVAIDEVENGLHPYAIMKLLTAMRARAEQDGVTVLLTSHSPVVMDQFRDREDQFFYFESTPDASRLKRLTEFRDEEWLRSFRIGSLYARGEFGAPKGRETGT